MSITDIFFLVVGSVLSCGLVARWPFGRHVSACRELMHKILWAFPSDRISDFRKARVAGRYSVEAIRLACLLLAGTIVPFVPVWLALSVVFGLSSDGLLIWTTVSASTVIVIVIATVFFVIR